MKPYSIGLQMSGLSARRERRLQEPDHFLPDVFLLADFDALFFDTAFFIVVTFEPVFFGMTPLEPLFLVAAFVGAVFFLATDFGADFVAAVLRATTFLMDLVFTGSFVTVSFFPGTFLATTFLPATLVDGDLLIRPGAAGFRFTLRRAAMTSTTSNVTSSPNFIASRADRGGGSPRYLNGTYPRSSPICTYAP